MVFHTGKEEKKRK